MPPARRDVRSVDPHARLRNSLNMEIAMKSLGQLERSYA